MWWTAVAAAADVALRLDWGASAAFSVVDQVEVAGEACVVRSTWHWIAVDGGHQLHVDEPVRVHGCRSLPDVQRAWSLTVGPDGVAARGEESTAPLAVTTSGLLVDDPVDTLERALLSVAGQTVPLGQPMRTNAGLYSPSTSRTEVLEVERRVDELPWCPDEGPGSRCVALTLIRAAPGAPLEGDLPEGAWRVTDVWTVEPDTLRPHAARRTVELAGAPVGTRAWRFLSR